LTNDSFNWYGILEMEALPPAKMLNIVLKDPGSTP
jgi:hypothetical protein